MVQNIKQPIQTIEDLYDNPEYRLTFVKSTAQESFFKHSKDSNYRKLWEKSMKEGMISLSYDGLEEKILEDSRLVLFEESPIFAGMADTYPCSITSSKLKYYPHYGAYVFRKDSEYIEIFNHALTDFFDSRMDSMDIYIRNLKKDCPKTNDDNFRPMSYDDVISAYALLIVGCFLSFGYLLIEFINRIGFQKKLLEEIEELRLRNNDMT